MEERIEFMTKTDNESLIYHRTKDKWKGNGSDKKNHSI
jgi:hypothetical protein